MWTPVSCSSVLIVHATPRSVWLPSRLPRAKASLILNVVGADVWPLPILQAGMFTQESRGIDITLTHFRSAATCMIISVSDWSVLRFWPKPRPWPLRVSEPMIMMFSARGWVSTGWLPSSPEMLSWWRLPFRCR